MKLDVVNQYFLANVVCWHRDLSVIAARALVKQLPNVSTVVCRRALKLQN